MLFLPKNLCLNFFFLFNFWKIFYVVKLKKIIFIFFFFFIIKTSTLMSFNNNKITHLKFFFFSLFKKRPRAQILNHKFKNNRLQKHFPKNNFLYKKNKNKNIIWAKKKKLINVKKINKFLIVNYYQHRTILQSLRTFNFTLTTFHNFKNYLNLRVWNNNFKFKQISSSKKKKTWKLWNKKNTFLLLKKKLKTHVALSKFILGIKPKRPFLITFNNLKDFLKKKSFGKTIISEDDKIDEKLCANAILKVTQTVSFFLILIKFFKFYYNLSCTQINLIYSVFSAHFYPLFTFNGLFSNLRKTAPGVESINFNIGQRLRFVSFSECLIFNFFFI